jgi:pantoate--beta-alanine ligase
MLIIKTQSQLSFYLSQFNKKIGFVPTMGALHDGHIYLIKQSKQAHDITVCSIFVNPTQFNNSIDFEKYPIQTASDIEKLYAAGCDCLYLPDVADIYLDGTAALSYYPLGHLDELLEGSYRPGHYQGVCNVVDRLLHIVNPHTLFLGEKDYQQCMVLKKLIQITNRSTDVVIVPTQREPGGLAMSSRNQRLSPESFNTANHIYQELTSVVNAFGKMSFAQAAQISIERLATYQIEVEYLSLADAESFHPLTDFEPDKEMVVLIAAYLEGVRLIDNIRFGK